MQAVHASLSIKPEGSAEFERLFAEQAARVHREEAGCLLYQLAKDRKKSGVCGHACSVGRAEDVEKRVELIPIRGGRHTLYWRSMSQLLR